MLYHNVEPFYKRIYCVFTPNVHFIALSIESMRKDCQEKCDKNENERNLIEDQK